MLSPEAEPLQPINAEQVRTALENRNTKLLNFWLFTGDKSARSVIRTVLGKHQKQKIEQYDLFGFVFMKSKISYGFRKIPNRLRFLIRYIEFGINFDVPCPKLKGLEYHDVYHLQDKFTNERIVNWVINTFDVALPLFIFHRCREKHFNVKSNIRKNHAYSYARKLYLIKSPYADEIQLDDYSSWKLALEFSSIARLNTISHVIYSYVAYHEIHLINRCSHLFINALARKIAEHCGYVPKYVNEIPKLRETVLMLMGSKYQTDGNVVMEQLEPYVRCRPLNVYSLGTKINLSSLRKEIQNFTALFPNKDSPIEGLCKADLRSLLWFRLGEGEPIDWEPMYFLDLNQTDRNIIFTLMVIWQCSESSMRNLPIELIFLIFNSYLGLFARCQ